MKTKNCGNCAGFVKVKNLYGGNGGICEYLDCRTDTDCGHDCDDWKGIKYQRVRKNDIKDLTL
jgi:hypothetical protein